MSDCRDQHEREVGGGGAGGDDHHHHHGHDHDHDSYERGLSSSLYQFIDVDNIRTLNAANEENVRKIFRPWDKRMEAEPVAESDCDDQMMIHVPLTGSCRIKSIWIRILERDHAPRFMTLYTNRDDLDFETAQSTTPTQDFRLLEAANDPLEYQTKLTKFINVRHLTIMLSRSRPPGAAASSAHSHSHGHDHGRGHGDAESAEEEDGGDNEDPIKLVYVGLQGEGVKINREPVIAIYEAVPDASDHPMTQVSSHRQSTV